MMRPMILVPALVVALLLVASSAPADAQIYRWVDERGVPHYADGIDRVPERYRAKVAPLELRNAPMSAKAPGASGPGAESRFPQGHPIIVDATLNGRPSAQLGRETG